MLKNLEKLSKRGDVAVTFKKFPKLVADPTTNEQKICEWRGDTAQKLRDEIDEAKKARQKAIAGGEKYIPCYLEGYIKAKEEDLRALGAEK